MACTSISVVQSEKRKRKTMTQICWPVCLLHKPGELRFCCSNIVCVERSSSLVEICFIRTVEYLNRYLFVLVFEPTIHILVMLEVDSMNHVRKRASSILKTWNKFRLVILTIVAIIRSHELQWLRVYWLQLDGSDLSLWGQLFHILASTHSVLLKSSFRRLSFSVLFLCLF